MKKLINKVTLASKIFHQPPLMDHIRYFSKRVFMKKKTPYMGIIGVTYRCPCNCSHCMTGIKQNKDTKEELCTSEIFNLLEEFRNLGILRVLLFGGEPFIREDILDIISYADNYNFVVAIDSNGYYITSDIVKYLQPIKRLEIAISLDSNIAPEHDRMRKCPGLFSKAVQAIRLCADKNIKVFVSTFVSRKRLKDGTIQNVIALAKTLGAKGVRLLVPICTGRWFHHTNECLSFKERERLKSLFNPRFVFLSDPFSFIFEKYPCCAALHRYLMYVSPFGDVQPCSAMPISFGNIRETSLKEIINKMVGSTIMSKSYKDCPMNDELFRQGFGHHFDPARDSPLCNSKFKKDII